MSEVVNAGVDDGDAVASDVVALDVVAADVGDAVVMGSVAGDTMSARRRIRDSVDVPQGATRDP